MFKPVEGKLEMPEPEQLKGMQVEQLTDLHEYGAQIRRDCKFNMLEDANTKMSAIERKKGMGETKHTLHHAHPDAVFVAKLGDKIMGYLAVKRTPEGKKSEIRQLWTAVPGRPQRAIAAHLINAAKGELTGRGYTRLSAMSENANLSIVKNSPDGGRYLRMIEPETGEAVAEDIVVSPEEENGLLEGISGMPTEVANDNELGSSLEKAA